MSLCERSYRRWRRHRLGRGRPC